MAEDPVATGLVLDGQFSLGGSFSSCLSPGELGRAGGGDVPTVISSTIREGASTGESPTPIGFNK